MSPRVDVRQKAEGFLLGPRTHGQEDGQVVVLMALFLALVGLLMIGTVLDSGLLGARNSAADSAAYLGAQAGAGTINQADFYNGTLALAGASGDICSQTGSGSQTGSCDEGGFRTAVGVCASVAGQNDASSSVTITCTQQGIDVTATVKQVVSFPVSVFGVTGKVASVRTAGATVGTNHYIPTPGSS